MDFFGKEMYEKGMEFQKKMMEQYMDGVRNYNKMFTEAVEKAEGAELSDAFDVEKMQQNTMDMMKSAADMSSSVMEFYMDAYKDASEAWKSAIATPAYFKQPEFAPLLDRMNFSADAFRKLFDFWNEFISSSMQFTGDPAEASKKMMEFSNKMVQDMTAGFFKPFGAEFPDSMADSLQSLGKTVLSFYNDFMKPWTSRQEAFVDNYIKAAGGDKEGMTNFIDMTQAAYEESFGKMLRMNNVGMTREHAAVAMQFADACVRMFLSSVEITAKMQTVMKEAGQETFDKVREMMEDEDKSVTFKDFYDLWIRVNSAAINKLYNTDEYSVFLNEFSGNAYDFKIKYDEFMERMLSGLPIPTNSEMKAVYKTVYDLRKDVRKLKKEIKDLRKELDELKGAK
ncbi:MAG: hypothetical protein IKD85_03605 [Firmicutes bacterium]|nr:hypothetical protein [Bacillota bacterium]